MLDNTAHQQWATRPHDQRFESPDLLRAAVAEVDAASLIDSHIPVRDVGIEIMERRFSLHSRDGMDARRFDLTDFSADQYLGRLGIPKRLLSVLSEPVARDVVVDRLASREDTHQRGLIMQQGDNGRTVRGFYGPQYQRVRDLTILDATLNDLPSVWHNPVAYQGGKWGAPMVGSGLYYGGDTRDLFMFFVDGGDALDLPSPSGQREVHRGFYAWNSEVGARSFGFARFLFDRVCGNHYIWGQTDFHMVRAVHRAGISDAFAIYCSFLEGLKDERPQFDQFKSAVAQAQDTKLWPVPRIEDDKATTAAAEVMRRRGGFSASETRNAIDAIWREEGGATTGGSAWDWLLGFTATARRMPHADARVHLEKQASAAFLPSEKMFAAVRN